MYRSGFKKQELTRDQTDCEISDEKDSLKLPLQAVALEKKKQSKFTKKVNKLKKDVEAGDVKLQEEIQPEIRKKPYRRGLVYIAHIPHGFYEKEMTNYFKQFGKITNVMICRSKRTGKSRGMGYVEFSNRDVAKIAAETMNNYLMFKRRIVAKFIPQEESTSSMFGKKVSKINPPALKRRRDTNNLKNKNISTTKYVKDAEKKLFNMQKKLKSLEALGINYNFKPVNCPKKLKMKNILGGIKEDVVATEKEQDIKLKVKRVQQKNIGNSKKRVNKKNNDEVNGKLNGNKKNDKQENVKNVDGIEKKVDGKKKNIKGIKKNVGIEKSLGGIKKKSTGIERGVTGIKKNVLPKEKNVKKSDAKMDLMKLTAKELLKSSDRVIKTRSDFRKLKNKKNK